MAQDMLPMETTERFELTQFLEGRAIAWGIVEDRFGVLRKRFTVEMRGFWEGKAFILDERFVYDTGDSETRRWSVVPLGDGRFSATCDDCIGHAVGQCTRDAIEMSYRFRLQVGARVIAVRFTDRIYRMSDDTAINRAIIRKWGVKLGELSIFFERQKSQPSAMSPHGTEPIESSFVPPV
jgi:hypothetical protein